MNESRAHATPFAIIQPAPNTIPMAPVPISSLSELEKCMGGTSAILFWTDWSGPSQRLRPLYEDLARIAAGARFFTVDVDRLRHDDMRPVVDRVPTVLLFLDGVQVGAVTGFDPTKLVEKILLLS